MKKLFFSMFFVLMPFITTDAQTSTVFSRSSIKCLGVELDGSQTLRVQGYGRNRSDAIE